MRLNLAGIVARFAPTALRARALPSARLADEILTGRGDRAVSQRMALTTFAIRIASAVIAYLTQVLLARWMGDFEYGVYVVVWVGAVIVGGLSCLGLQTAMIRFVPEYMARGEHDLARGVIFGGRLQGVGAATFFAGLGIVGIALFGNHLTSYYVMPLYLAAVAVPMLAIGEIQDGISRGFHWPDLSLWPTFIIRPLLIILLTGLAIYFGAAPNAVMAMTTAVIATYLTSLGQLTAIALRARRTVPQVPRRYRLKYWMNVAFPIFLVEGFFNLLTNVDILVVGQLRAPEEVAVYFATVKTLALVNFVYFAVRAATMPRFSQYYAMGDHVRFEAIVRDSLHWTFWPSAAMVVVLIVLGRPLLAIFGPTFVAGYPLIFILSFGLLVRASIGPAETILTMAGEQRICAVVYAGTFVANLLLNYTLVPLYGLTGASVATAAALIIETVSVYFAVRSRLRLRCSIWHAMGPPGAMHLPPRPGESR